MLSFNAMKNIRNGRDLRAVVQKARSGLLAVFLAMVAVGCHSASRTQASPPSPVFREAFGEIKSAPRITVQAVHAREMNAIAISKTNAAQVTAGEAASASPTNATAKEATNLVAALRTAMETLPAVQTNAISKEKSAALAAAQAASASYTNAIQEGDVISILFDDSTNFNTVTKISLDGMCNLKGAAPIKAAGKTPQQLQSELQALYQPQVKDEPISVSIISTTSSIYVSGAVLRSGRIPLEHPMTVLEGIMEAGGFDSNRAKLSSVTVIRMENGRAQTYHINVKRILEGKNPEPFYLRPFDVLHVPSKTFNF